MSINQQQPEEEQSEVGVDGDAVSALSFTVEWLADSQLLKLMRSEGLANPNWLSCLAANLRALSRPDANYEWDGYDSEQARVQYEEWFKASGLDLAQAWTACSDSPAPTMEKWDKITQYKLDPGLAAKRNLATAIKASFAKDRKREQQQCAAGKAGLDPSRIVYDMAAQTWRLQIADDSWDTPITTGALDRYLSKFGVIGKKSLDEVKSRMRVVRASKKFYATADTFVKDRGLLYMNTYEPGRVVPRKGKWKNIYKLLLNICGGDQAAVRFVIGWTAAWMQALLVQKKPIMMRTALVFWGEKGSGKDTFLQLLTHILGESNVGIINQDGLDSRFTDNIEHSILVHANEVISSTNRAAVTTNKIKNWVTDSRIRVEKKFLSPDAMKHTFNMVFTSNSSKAVVLEKGDRRFSVFHGPDKMEVKYPDELNAIYADMDGSQTELAAFMYTLLHTKGVVRQGKLYENRARREMLAESRTSYEAWLDEYRETGYAYMADLWVRDDPHFGTLNYPARIAYYKYELTVVVPEDTIYQVYSNWCERAAQHPIRKDSFLLAVERDLKLEKIRPRIEGDNGVKMRPRAYLGLSLEGSPDVTQIDIRSTQGVSAKPTGPEFGVDLIA